MALSDVVKNISVDVSRVAPTPTVFAKQNENGKRQVIVKLMKDGQPFTIGTGVGGYIQGATAPNPITQRSTKFKRTLTNIDTTANTASFYIAQSMTAEVGTTQCEIALYSTGSEQSMLCTANINIEVQGTGMSPQDEMASDDYQAIEIIKTEVTAMRDEVRTKTDQAIAAQGAAETAAQNAYNSALGVQKIVAGNEAYTKQETDLKYSVAPRKVQTSTTGELKLTDADYGLSYLELQGNSEQYTNTASKNLFDLEYQKLYGINENRYLNINGAITTPATDKDWKISYYIKVKQSTTYVFTNLPTSTVTYLVFYTGEKAFISAVTNNSIVNTNDNKIVTPANCEYIRMSYRAMVENTLQLEEGETATAYIKGTVDTPSPEYPSEVKSVGDIPKDVNGVEIRNILDIDGILAKPESEWTVTAERIFATPLDVSKTKINGRLFKAFDRPDINVGLSTGAKAMTDGTSGFYLGATSIPIKGFDFSLSTTVYLFIYFTGAVPSLTEVKEILDKERNKFVFTYANEVDEHRPYIGENNGLVKIESTGINKVNVGQEPVYKSGQSSLNVNRWTQQEIILEQKGKTTSYAYADGGFVGGKTYSFYCRAQAEVIEGSATSGVTSVGLRKYPPSESMYGQTLIRHDGVYHDCYAKTTIPENISPYNFAFMFYLSASAATSGNIRLTIKDLMIVEGDKTLQEMKALKYQPYYNQITWIPLREPLRAIKTDYNVFGDIVDKQGNVTEKIMKMKMSEVLNLNNGWGADPTGINARSSDIKFAYYTMDNIYKPPDNNKDIPCLCEKLKYSKEGLSPAMESIWHSSVIVFQIKNIRTGLSDAETDTIVIAKGIRDYITTNDYVVYYLLSEASFSNYQIPIVYIETYDQETNVRCLNKVKPSSMGLDYKIAISSLIKRLEALETTAVTEVNKNV